MLVVTEWPGQSAEVVQEQVTKTLEREFADLEGLVSLNSASSAGRSVIVITTENEPDPLLYMERLKGVLPQLPQQVYPKLLDYAEPKNMMLYCIKSDAVPKHELVAYNRTDIEQQFVQQAGVSQFFTIGQNWTETRIVPDLKLLKKYGMDLGELSVRIDEYIHSINSNVNVTVPLADMVLKENLSVLRLKDVATISEGEGRDDMAAFENGQEAVMGAVIFRKEVQPDEMSKRLEEILAKPVLPQPQGTVVTPFLLGGNAGGGDKNLCVLHVEYPLAADLENRKALAQKINTMVKEEPGVQSAFIQIGFSPNADVMESHEIMIYMVLGNDAETSEVERSLHVKLNAVPGIRHYFTLPQDKPHSVKVFAEDRKTGQEILRQMMEKMQSLEGITGIGANGMADMPERTYAIRREKMSAAGISFEQVQAVLGAASGKSWFDRGSFVRLYPDKAATAELEVKGPRGFVPITQIADVRSESLPFVLLRENLKDYLCLHFSTTDKDVLKRVEEISKEINLPAGASVVIE